MTSESTRDGKAAHPFVSDLEPFLYGRPITYVDVGAYHGGVLLELLNSALRVREAHLIEPNPTSFQTLRENTGDLGATTRVACHQLAISSSPGVLSMRDEGTMTHVSSTPAHGLGVADADQLFFEVRSVTLDELARDYELRHIHLLKIDVEGHELAVLEGAKDLLATGSVDVVYLEAGMNPEATQHVYYRDVEDALRAYGYRLHRFYEQRHEWPTDDPSLRRANMAFFSSAFAATNPYRVSRELFRLRKRYDELKSRSGESDATAQELRTQVAHLKERADEAVARAEGSDAERSRLEQELVAARRERDAFVAYADELEAGYRKVLGSSSWRMTGPFRVGVRTVRRVFGRPGSARSRLPARPTPKQLRTGVSGAGAAGTVDDVLLRLKTSDFAGAYQLCRQLEVDVASREGFLGHAFATVALAKKSSTFAFGAQAADAVLRRYERRADLADALGSKGYQRFVADAAACYTRIGRYDDARALLDASIDAGAAELLPVRAEICWIHDAGQAARDLDTHLARVRGDTNQAANVLLREHIAVNLLGESADAAAAGERSGESRLVHAIRALDEGRVDDYRRLVNGFFTDQGLSAPFAAMSGDPFSFDELSAPPGGSVPDPHGALVSVIMTTHNSADTVGYAVRSILAQTHRNLELIVIDDASSDDTVTVLDELAAADDRIRVLRNPENTGTYAARNVAMAQAKGDYLTFHDSDDWAHPQRLTAHLGVMADEPNLLVTRSNWLRTEPAGKIDFRRWHKRLAHPNPASIFIKREVIDRIGYFDTVRFGADSEYWFRAIRTCGRSAVSSLPACLGIGMHHPASLTRGGLGGRDIEEYSPIRAAYQYSWLEWQSRRPTDELKLAADPTDRPFWAPPAMLARPAPSNATLPGLARSYPGLAERDVPTFVFGISLASEKASSDWPRTVQLLGRTLRSVLNQTDGRWRAIVCGHERPDLPELDDPRVMFVVANVDPPKDAKNFRKDKMWKRRLIGSILRDLGGGYFCPLDADDLVHKSLVEHVLADDNRRGYNIGTGYAEDFANGRLAPVPGVWAAPFDRVCGTSAVLYFSPDELPLDGQLDPALYFNLFQSHAYWPVVAEECGRPLDPVPFPGAVYVVNHSQNLSFGLQRAGGRTANIIAAIERHALGDGADVLTDTFGQRDDG